PSPTQQSGNFAAENPLGHLRRLYLILPLRDLLFYPPHLLCAQLISSFCESVDALLTAGIGGEGCLDRLACARPPLFPFFPHAGNGHLYSLPICRNTAAWSQ